MELRTRSITKTPHTKILLGKMLYSYRVTTLHTCKSLCFPAWNHFIRTYLLIWNLSPEFAFCYENFLTFVNPMQNKYFCNEKCCLWTFIFFLGTKTHKIDFELAAFSQEFLPINPWILMHHLELSCKITKAKVHASLSSNLLITQRLRCWSFYHLFHVLLACSK